ncbi:MAG: hypothetical protein JWN46_3975 [Acidimicrobiales bacterium]|nr:hypothetical protein [Acidimicrobiales bacterium]
MDQRDRPADDDLPEHTDDRLDDETSREALELELMDKDASEAGEEIGDEMP